MKIKCPHCKQDYDLTAQEILDIGSRKVECAACQKSFHLDEVIKSLNEYLYVAELEVELNKQLEEKEFLKHHPDIDARDDDRYWTLDRVQDECTRLREEIKDAKADWAEAKKEEHDEITDESYAMTMVELLENGIIVKLPDLTTKARIFSLSSMHNLEDDDMCKWLFKNLPNVFAPKVRELIRLIEESPYIPAPPRSLWRMTGDATEKPINYLRDLGYSDIPHNIGKQDASWLISAAKHDNDRLREEWREIIPNAVDVIDECIAAFTH